MLANLNLMLGATNYSLKNAYFKILNWEGFNLADSLN